MLMSFSYLYKKFRQLNVCWKQLHNLPLDVVLQRTAVSRSVNFVPLERLKA